MPRFRFRITADANEGKLAFAKAVLGKRSGTFLKNSE